MAISTLKNKFEKNICLQWAEFGQAHDALWHVDFNEHISDYLPFEFRMKLDNKNHVKDHDNMNIRILHCSTIKNTNTKKKSSVPFILSHIHFTGFNEK